MRAPKRSQISGDDSDAPFAGNHEKTDSSGSKERPIIQSENTPAPNAQQAAPAKQADKRWRSWWRRFYAEFYSAHPDKQIAQIYYIATILALTGSLIAGIWAFGGEFFFKKSALEAGRPAKEPATTVATQSDIGRAHV